MKFFKKNFTYILLIGLVLSAIFLIYFIYQKDFRHKYLKVIFLNVGQGDSIFIEAPNGKQVLIDGGPDKKVLPLLSRFMPLGDNSLDMVIATHPDQDHISGLIDVLSSYKVGAVMESEMIGDTSTYNNLQTEIKNKNIKSIKGVAGMKIILDETRDIYLLILSPFNDTPLVDTNDSSIVAKLVYGDKSFLFTGDAEIYSEIIMYQKEKQLLDSDVLKLGHHGSRGSSSVLFLENVSPSVAIVSAGKNNKYGHPNSEVLDKLKDMNIPLLSTIDRGSIIFKTDGEKLILK